MIIIIHSIIIIDFPHDFDNLTNDRLVFKFLLGNLPFNELFFYLLQLVSWKQLPDNKF